MGRTRRVGPAGRLGPRYGVKVRKRTVKIEREQRRMQKCPSCGAVKAKRLTSGIWQCRRCGTKFTGGAYLP